KGLKSRTGNRRRSWPIPESSRPTWGMRVVLEVRHVSAGYGPLTVLRDVSLRVEPGELVAVIGSNGAGKSTLIRAVAGLIRPWSPDGRHTILLDGEPIHGLPPYAIARRGLAVVPEGARVFPRMSVLDNLWVGSFMPEARRA